MDVNEASAFVPEAWSKAYVDRVASTSVLLARIERQRLGPEVGFSGSWGTVVFPDGTKFEIEDVSFDGRGDDLKAYGRKVVKREVPDEAAQDDFQSLLAKWRDEGKGEIADRVASAEDEYGYSVQTLIVSRVEEVVQREALVNDCKFYRSLMSRPLTVVIPKFGDIEPYSVAVELSGTSDITVTKAAYRSVAEMDFGLSEADYRKAWDALNAANEPREGVRFAREDHNVMLDAVSDTLRRNMDAAEAAGVVFDTSEPHG